MKLRSGKTVAPKPPQAHVDVSSIAVRLNQSELTQLQSLKENSKK